MQELHEEIIDVLNLLNHSTRCKKCSQSLIHTLCNFFGDLAINLGAASIFLSESSKYAPLTLDYVVVVYLPLKANLLNEKHILSTFMV